MTLYFFTGFEGCNSSLEVRQLFDTYDGSGILPIYSSTNGYENGKSIVSVNTMAVAKDLPSGLKTVCLGMHKRTLVSSSGTPYDSYECRDYFRFVIGSTYVAIKIRNGEWEAYLGDSTSLGVGTISPNLADDTLHHLECKVYSHASSGYVQIKVNGSLVLNLSNLNTDGSDITRVWWGTSYAFGTNDPMDNLYAADDFQGELYSQVFYPNSDGDQSDFSPTSGTDHYAMVDDVTIDNDTTVLESNNVGDKELFGFENLTLDNNSIVGVSLFTYARKTSGVARSLQHLSKQDSTERTHDEKALNIEWISTTGYALMDTFALCPDGTAWTVTKLNAMQWGFTLSV